MLGHISLKGLSAASGVVTHIPDASRSATSREIRATFLRMQSVSESFRLGPTETC